MDQATCDLPSYIIPQCDLLIKWNLTDFIEQFAAQKIDIATMLLLTKDDIATLFPRIGDRVRFETSLKLYKNDQGNYIMYNPPDISYNIEEVLTDDYQLFNLEPQGESVNKVIQDTGGGEAGCSRKDSSLTQSNLVHNILNASAEGKQILEIGQKTGTLTSVVRGRLCKLLMEKLITAENPTLLSDTQLLALSNDIGRLFVKESPPLYYAPYIPADAYQAKRNTSGWLVSARRARRAHLISLGLLEKPKSRSRSRSSNQSVSLPYPGIDLEGLAEGDLEDVTTALERLSSPSIGPWQEITALWRETVRARLRYLYYEQGSLQEYFNKYPVLKSSNGWRLLTYDYDALFPNKSGGLDALKGCTEIIIKAAEEKLRTAKDKFHREKIIDTLKICDDSKPETRVIAAILLLGCLFNIPPARRSKKDWHASRAEILDGFVTHVNSEAEVQVTIEERRQKLQILGVTLQPFIIWCRETGASFTVCDDVIYRFENLPEAVDVTFKIFHATAAKYPTESYFIWIIIQIAFYKVKTSYDRLSQSVKETLVTLGVTIN